MKSLDAVAFGTCYVDTNAHEYPFSAAGIPPETELIGGTYEIVPGGSAVNFCRLLQQLGLHTAFIGIAGTDPNGDALESLLHESGVKPLITRRPDLQTNIGFNMTNPAGQHIMLVGGTANAALDPDIVITTLKEILPDTKLLYLGGCFKLKAFRQAFAQVSALAAQAGTQVVVDHNRIPADTDSEMIEAVKQLVLSSDIYLPSHDEFCQLWGVDSIDEGLRLLASQAPNLTVIVTDGSNGAYHMPNGKVKHVPALKVEKVLNATGAGDSFNAGIMTAITAGRSIEDAASYACTVAAAHIAGQPLPALSL